MSAFAVIAARYGVDPTDEEAVDRFFDEHAPDLPAEEREAILADLLSGDGDGDSPPRRHYAKAAEGASFKDDPGIEVPRRAVNPRRDVVEMSAIGRSLKSCFADFLTLAGLNVIVDVSAVDETRLTLAVDGPEAKRLNEDARGLFASIRGLTDYIVAAQPAIDEIDVIVCRSGDDGNFFERSGRHKLHVRQILDEPRVVKMESIHVETMTLQIAAKTLQSSDKEFIVFRDETTDSVSTIYKRRNGELGLICT